MHRQRIASPIPFLLLVAASALVVPAAAAFEIGEGQIVAAFVPQLTGDPERDFARSVNPGETVTIYVIAGRLAETISSYGFGFLISEAASAALGEVRTLGDVLAWQNSIGTFVTVTVSARAGCLGIESGTVLGEVELVFFVDEGALSLNLASSIEAGDPPNYELCSGGLFPFDVSAAEVLTIRLGGASPITNVTWSSMKSLFDSR